MEEEEEKRREENRENLRFKKEGIEGDISTREKNRRCERSINRCLARNEPQRAREEKKDGVEALWKEWKTKRGRRKAEKREVFLSLTCEWKRRPRWSLPASELYIHPVLRAFEKDRSPSHRILLERQEVFLLGGRGESRRQVEWKGEEREFDRVFFFRVHEIASY